MIVPRRNGWIASMNQSRVGALAVTSWAKAAPGFMPENQESPGLVAVEA